MVEIASLLASSKTAYDIAKGLTSVYVDYKVQEQTAALLKILLSVETDALSIQSKHNEAIVTMGNLKKKILELENWIETMRQYEIKDIADGVFVLAYKKTEQSTEPMHWLCQKCYGEKKKSILQRVKHDSQGIHYICHSCSSEIIDHTNRIKRGPSQYDGAIKPR
jgi:hypothetical protein